MLSKFILIVLILINVKAFADEVPLNNIVANYALFYKNIDAGTMRLEIQSNNNYVQIRTKYDGNFLAELANRGYREEISLLKKEMSDLKIEKYSYTDEKDAYNAKKNTLIQIHDVKVNYPMKAKLITNLASDLNKFNVKIKKISYSEKNTKKEFTLSLLASNDKKITQLVEFLTKKYDNNLNISLEEISLQDDNNMYLSEVKVRIL